MRGRRAAVKIHSVLRCWGVCSMARTAHPAPACQHLGQPIIMCELTSDLTPGRANNNRFAVDLDKPLGLSFRYFNRKWRSLNKPLNKMMMSLIPFSYKNAASSTSVCVCLLNCYK